MTTSEKAIDDRLIGQAFGVRQSEVQQRAAEEKAVRVVSTARIRLILGKDAKSVFFATLALGLEVKMRWDIATMATDGKYLFVNPDFANGLTPDEAVGVVAHEVMHPAMAHHARRGQRDPLRWNIAADLAINPLLKEAGFTLPKGHIFPGMPLSNSNDASAKWLAAVSKMKAGLAAEEYYAQLPELGQQEDGQNGTADGGETFPDIGGCGAVIDAGDGGQAAQKQAERQWRTRVAQAAALSKKKGALPGGFERLVDQVLEPAVPWQQVLREFVTRTAKNEYRWNRPNKRFVHQDLYLPALGGESLGDVVVAVDTSGSIGGPILDRFAAEMQGILDAYDVELTILYCDCAIRQVQKWTPANGALKLDPRGGGGTSHKPVFEWIANSALDPSCVICLTDLDTEFPDVIPAVPVLWAVVGNRRGAAPFGVVLPVTI